MEDKKTPNFNNLNAEQINAIELIRVTWISDLKDASNIIRPHAGILHAFSKTSNGTNTKELNSDWANVYDGFLDLIVYLTGALFKLDYNKFIKSDVYKSQDILTQKAMQRIIQWNKDRDLTEFDAKREFAYVCEETYELVFKDHKNSREQGLEIAKNAFMKPYNERIEPENENEEPQYVTKIREVDLTPNKSFILFSSLLDSAIRSAKNVAYFVGIKNIDYLNKVLDANDQKGKKKDEFGKVLKDKATFKEPEKDWK